MADEQPLHKGFVLGSIAYSLGKKADDNKSHEWTVYVRAANPEEDPSLYIRKVIFHLHPTLQPPSRTIETAPFEVTEQGWGEFEISVQIFFHDSKEQPVEMMHQLRLYPPNDAPASQVAKPVVAERYDEFVFNTPSDALRTKLSADIVPGPKDNPKVWKYSPHAKWWTDYDAEYDARTDRLQEIYTQITAQLQEASKRRRILEEENEAIAKRQS